ncbi:transcription factor bHLH117-like [Durio zibethinus]|uniref:Transcription factor bHLH117-like n=1 Tax=Durio zibethinus TaxID=66656 RepID=A0A6P5XGM7_DURZI|nr:transcription factor bHLH117-like [Durio zibethinus]
MKMKRDDFCSSFGSITTHPHAYPYFTTEFNPQTLLLLPSDPRCFNLFFTQDFPSDLPLQPQVPPLDFSLYSSSILPHSTFFLNFFSKPFHSLQQPHHQPPLLRHSSPSSSSRLLKCTRLHLNISQSDNNPQTLDSIVQSFNSPPPIIPHSGLARKRRQKLSEKTRCLQKLMPWDKKMDTGTMLQEAYKYIRFLQAQISILQSMPITSSFVSGEHINAPFAFDYNGLERLNRQQLLQVLVNSPGAQTRLYSNDFCVFSYEQLVSLKKAKEERKTVLQHFLFGN